MELIVSKIKKFMMLSVLLISLPLSAGEWMNGFLTGVGASIATGCVIVATPIAMFMYDQSKKTPQVNNDHKIDLLPKDDIRIKNAAVEREAEELAILQNQQNEQVRIEKRELEQVALKRWEQVDSAMWDNI